MSGVRNCARVGSSAVFARGDAPVVVGTDPTRRKCPSVLPAQQTTLVPSRIKMVENILSDPECLEKNHNGIKADGNLSIERVA